MTSRSDLFNQYTITLDHPNQNKAKKKLTRAAAKDGYRGTAKFKYERGLTPQLTPVYRYTLIAYRLLTA